MPFLKRRNVSSLLDRGATTRKLTVACRSKIHDGILGILRIDSSISSIKYAQLTGRWLHSGGIGSSRYSHRCRKPDPLRFRTFAVASYIWSAGIDTFQSPLPLPSFSHACGSILAKDSTDSITRDGKLKEFCLSKGEAPTVSSSTSL